MQSAEQQQYKTQETLGDKLSLCHFDYILIELPRDLIFIYIINGANIRFETVPKPNRTHTRIGL